jgi:tetratricopeptide (TPR) repeat protein
MLLLDYSKLDLEKIKGNESFRLGENDSAVSCYSASLAMDDTVAAVWANRAMAYIRMELFDLAEQDCSMALQLDGTYIKALSRRGLVRFKRGKYAEVQCAKF